MAVMGSFISPTTGNVVTYDEAGKQTDTGSTTPVQNDPWTDLATANLITNQPAEQAANSNLNNWANTPVNDYSDYTAKTAAANNDPTSAYLNGGAPALSQADWNAEVARAEADAANGVTYGGGGGAITPTGQAGSVSLINPAVQAQVPGIDQNIINNYLAQTPVNTGGFGPSVISNQGVTYKPPTATNTMIPGSSTGASNRGPLTNIWNPAPTVQGGYNTPVVDSLYSNMQQNFGGPKPTFNFQSKPAFKTGGSVGALTRVIKHGI